MISIINSIIMTIMFFSFIMYFNSNHPMLMAFMIISQCILMASFLASVIMFSWFSFFVFIIYLGGILMLFCYVISLMNSHKPIFKTNILTSLTTVTYFFFNLNMEKESFLEISKSKFLSLIMSSFSYSSMKMSIFMMLFLLMVMVMVVFITEMSKGTMRKF